MASPFDMGRSVRSQVFFSDCAEFKEGKLAVNGTVYEGVTSQTEDFSSRPVASMGSSTTREVILLDSKYSPVLNAKFAELKEILTEQALQKKTALTEEEVVQTVHTFVQTAIFNKSPFAVDQFIQDKQTSKDIEKIHIVPVEVTCISLDDFAKTGGGVCRHHALATAYLIHRLTIGPKALLKGVVQQMRDNVDGVKGRGAHVWVSYVNHEKRMHIDTLWKIFFPDFTQSHVKEILLSSYGKNAYENQYKKTLLTFEKAKAAELARINHIMEAVIAFLKKSPIPQEATPHIGLAAQSTSILRIHTLSWMRANSYRNQLFGRFNQLMQKANVTQEEYDRTAQALEKAMLKSGTPVLSNIAIYLTAVYENILESDPGLPSKDLQLVLTLLHKEAWNNVIEEYSLVYKSPKDPKALVDLKLVLSELKSGSLNKETFNKLPVFVKNAIFGKTYRIEKKADRPTKGDPEFGRHAFLDEGKTISNATRVLAIQHYMLDVIANLFLHGEDAEAMEALLLLDQNFRNVHVYGPMWEVCGKPSGDSHYGARAFHGEKSKLQGEALRQKRVEALRLHA